MGLNPASLDIFPFYIKIVQGSRNSPKKQNITRKSFFSSPACSYYQNQEMVFLIIALIVQKYRSDTLYGTFNAMSLKAALDRMKRKSRI